MHADCVKDLIRLRPPRIVYISCNPLTQFRDIQLLEKVKPEALQGYLTYKKTQPPRTLP